MAVVSKLVYIPCVGPTVYKIYEYSKQHEKEEPVGPWHRGHLIFIFLFNSILNRPFVIPGGLA